MTGTEGAPGLHLRPVAPYIEAQLPVLFGGLSEILSLSPVGSEVCQGSLGPEGCCKGFGWSGDRSKRSFGEELFPARLASPATSVHRMRTVIQLTYSSSTPRLQAPGPDRQCVQTQTHIHIYKHIFIYVHAYNICIYIYIYICRSVHIYVNLCLMYTHSSLYCLSLITGAPSSPPS